MEEPRQIGGAMIGRTLGGYRIEAWLGGEAMGRVFRGIEEATGRTVAIKVARHEALVSPDRLRKEALILSHFQHPNIPQVFGVGKSEEICYLVMEYIDGPTLLEVLARVVALPWPRVVELGLQICEALRYVHQHGVVHRNLKPSHLILSEQGQVKLVGFGIAKDLDRAPLAATGRTVGTAAYMAPEQICGTPAISHKTDLYALGVVLYKALVGSTPFAGDSPVAQFKCHLHEPPPRPGEKVPEIPQALDDFIFKLMAKAPSDRPWDAAGAANILSKILPDGSKRPAENAIPPFLAGGVRHNRPPRLPKPLREVIRFLRGEPRWMERADSQRPYFEDSLWDPEIDESNR